MRKRIFSFALCILLMISNFLVVPVSASSIPMDDGTVDFFSWVFDAGGHAINTFLSFFDHSVCPLAPPGVGRHSFVKQHTMVGDKIGYFYICEYCGVSAGEVGEEAYQQQVSDLPASGYNSAGRLIWQLTVNDLSSDSKFGLYNGNNWTEVALSAIPYSDSNRAVSVREDSLGFLFKFSDRYCWVSSTISAQCPFNGSYCLLETSRFSYSGLKSDGSSVSGDGTWKAGSFSHCFGGDIFTFSSGSTFGYGTGSLSFSTLNFYLPVYEVIPDTAIDTTSGGQYSINTRPTVIEGGNYGIIGDDGQLIINNDNRQIINEGDNIYYNPDTGETYNITNWTYDYDGRIYNITLDTGDKVSVEYGDENITITENTINEGDTIVNNYTIYYIIDGSGADPDPTPGPTACPHDWQAGTSTVPTCTAPGKTAYTCSKCGETKTETVPALGHDWQVLRTVPTEYDEDGNQTQAGYTLYECTRCGEQYKDEDSTGPPGNDVDDGGLLAWLNGLIKHLSDNLSGVVALMKRFFTEIPELFGGFTGFLAAVFPFLPEEITLLLTFGMAALVVVGVIKAIRR